MHVYDDDSGEFEGPDEHDRDLLEDEERDDDEYEQPCPNCGARVYEMWPKCRRCGYHLSHADTSTAAARSRGWFWGIMVAVLIAIILVIWSGLSW